MGIDEVIERERLPAGYRRIVEQVHAPIAARVLRESLAKDGALTVGVCGSQGSGKSTMALMLEALLQEQGVASAVFSLDDLYLTRRDRIALAERVHPLLRTRGVPGTHDVRLGLDVIRGLRAARMVALPSFDKAADDRRPVEQWRRIEGPVKVIILEGWCVGAIAQDAASLQEPINALERELDPHGVWRRYVNEALAGEYRQLFAELDRLILLEAPSFEVVYDWRLEQEHKLRQRIAQEGSGAAHIMSDGEVKRFISHYERLTRHILDEMPARADVVVHLDAHREPLCIDMK